MIFITIKKTKMETVNSLSGGKTSSYMAVHYPADYNIFAVVCIDDPKCAPKDKQIVQAINDRLGAEKIKTYGEFIASAEDDKTLKVIFDLEQKLGKEIIWTRGDSFDAINKKSNAIPNYVRRFCTTGMKLDPIFYWWQDNFNEQTVSMNLGYRIDEIERGYMYDESIKKFVPKPEKPYHAIVGKSKNGRNKWADVYWRETNYPLITNQVNHRMVREWAETTALDFPSDSNCVGCFWKNVQQLRKNWDDNPEKMQWFADQEKKIKSKSGKPRRWKTEATYEQIKTIGLQQDFFFGTGSGCQAGFCTD
jgi:hypothetical protein